MVEADEGAQRSNRIHASSHAPSQLNVGVRPHTAIVPAQPVAASVGGRPVRALGDGRAGALVPEGGAPEVTGMSARPILEEILRLPPDQRLRLIEDIWESLAASPADVPVPDWHRELLDERLADAGEQPSRTWDEVQAAARRGRR